LATATKEKNVLNGKVALVSGAASGIGAAIAQRIVDHGAKVVIGVEQQVFGRQALAASVQGRRGR
jgi:NAD(P)-dependent dehydrogenase (short-subunit alcohol dehydrogenase family)